LKAGDEDAPSSTSFEPISRQAEKQLSNPTKQKSNRQYRRLKYLGFDEQSKVGFYLLQQILLF